MAIELPDLLNVAPKLIPVIARVNEFRYFLLEGGRSSSKSQTVARFILWLCEQKYIRVVCGRETQNTIEESVYAIFKDLITKYSLAFDVFANKIVHKITKTEIHFRGLREQGKVNIQGLEGVDILWVDESQSITDPTLKVIIPTIRKEHAKIFWTMNRHVENDPVFIEFSNRADCLHIHIDYLDNPFCPEAMKQEAETMRTTNYQDYEHIWLGKPLLKSDDHLFSIDDIRNSLFIEFNVIGEQKRVMGVDVARFGDNETVFSILESRGILQWEQIHQEAYKGRGIDETVGKIVEMHRTFALSSIAIDDDGLGGGVTDMLRSFNLPVYAFNGGTESKNAKYFNARAEGYFKLVEWLQRGWIKLINDKALHDQLLDIRYKFRPTGQRILFSKDEMRKEGIESPDRADALMIAAYYADHVHQRVNNYPGNTKHMQGSHYAVMR